MILGWAAAAFFSASNMAQAMTIGGLRQTCIEEDPSFCHGYIFGVVEVASGFLDRTMCVPDGVKAPQLAAIFVRWADQNPQQWHQHAADGIPQAVAAAFQRSGLFADGACVAKAGK